MGLRPGRTTPSEFRACLRYIAKPLKTPKPKQAKREKEANFRNSIQAADYAK